MKKTSKFSEIFDISRTFFVVKAVVKVLEAFFAKT